MRTLRNFTIGVIFGIILTYDVLWTAATEALAREHASTRARHAA